VTAGTGCAWTAESNVSWITVTPSSGTGNGTVNYMYAAKNTTPPRTGTLTIAGQIFTLTQPGDCQITLSPTTQSVSSAGGSFSVGWTVPSGCGQMPWTAASNSAWITGVSPSSGTGSGSVSYTVAATTGTTARTGTLTIAGQTFTVKQSVITQREKIVFSKQESSDNYDLWMMNPDGTNLQKLTDEAKSGTNSTFPSIFPDGKKVLYQRGYNIAVVDVTTLQITALNHRWRKRQLCIQCPPFII